ncbi:MAG TPA: glycosyltransferase family 4 protein [Terracidiphilus sp.]|nr:glycosyltransferase family 4 protein [Terracidiphilus sp.]
MWLIEALKRDCEITIITTGGWDLADLNAYYGTHISDDEVTVRIAPVPRLIRNRSAAAIRGACFQRFAHQVAGEYDVRISSYNPTDWGLPAIHFIADFSWNAKIRERLHPQSPGLIYKDTILRRIYLDMAEMCARPSGRDVLHDGVLIANSGWTSKVIRESFNIDCAGVVYPPVWSVFPEVAWEQKEFAFVMIGRIAPEKKVEQSIAILNAVRSRGHAIKLRLCGRFGDDLYAKRIAQICEEHSQWIVLEGQVSGVRKAQILSSCRFGIQATSAESFGISIAEMVKAGAVVFAHDDGGQAEILNHPSLLFKSEDDAVNKICDVLSLEQKCTALRANLANQAQLFSASAFIQGARQCVASFLEVHQSESRAVANPVS